MGSRENQVLLLHHQHGFISCNRNNHQNHLTNSREERNCDRIPRKTSHELNRTHQKHSAPTSKTKIVGSMAPIDRPPNKIGFLISAILLLLVATPYASGQRIPLSPHQQALPRPGPFLASGNSLALHQRATRYARQQAAAPEPVNRPFPPPPMLDMMTGYKVEPQIRQLIMPYDGYTLNGTEPDASYVIENKRFVEAVSSRCWSSTVLEDPESVEPSFIIIRPKSEVRINATAPIALIRMANFDPTKATTILIHGFTQSYPNTAWLRRVRALFERHYVIEMQNLIIMDWGGSSQGSYAQVAGMVSGMGSFLANFLMKLIEMGADRSRIHIIGHSLGAHLAGFGGKRVRPRIGRITALDPAGPCFGKFFSNGANDRLSANDAYEVDVYHYDDSFLGLPGQHGHFDIYVNGGSTQPGCVGNANAMLQALITIIFRRDRVLSESHTRSTEVSSSRFADTSCQGVAYECRDYGAFIQGECGKCDQFNGQCFLMGFEFQYPEEILSRREPPLRTTPTSKRLYITTGPAENYCQQHYQILVKFEPSPEMALAAKRHKWRLHLDLRTDQPDLRLNVTLTNQMAPNVFSYLLLTQTPPFRLVGAQLQVLQSDGAQVRMSPPPQQPARWPSKPQQPQTFWPFAIEINYMSNINPEVRRLISSRLCPMAQPQMNQILGSSSQAQHMLAPSGNSINLLQFDECLPSPVG